MNEYDIWNGLAVAGPLVFLFGLGLIWIVGSYITRNDKK